MPKRRDLLRFALAAASIPALARPASAFRWPWSDEPEADSSLRIQRYRELGTTGLSMGDVGFGVSVTADPRLLVEAFERGVNYFDIVPMYPWSVKMLADAFAMSPRMKREAIVASKLICFDLSLMSEQPKSPHEIYVHCIDETLRTLGRDHLDIYMIHGVGCRGEEDLAWLDPDSEQGAGALQAFDMLKKQGKIRACGLTSHGPRILRRVAREAIESGHFDVLLLAMNFMHSPGLENELRLAEERGVGVVAMKALANARALDVQGAGGESTAQAAIAWANEQPGVAGTVITIPDRRTLNDFLGASGRALGTAGRARLDRHRVATSADYCRVGCGDCMDSCPAGVEVPTFLRIDQYRRHYGQPEMARRSYATLPEGTSLSACLSCTGEPCADACPHGVDIRRGTLTAHRHLDPGGAGSA